MNAVSLSSSAALVPAAEIWCTDNQYANQVDNQTDNQLGKSLVGLLPSAAECDAVPHATAADRALWRSVREHPSLWQQPRPRKGASKGTQQALLAARGHTIICDALGCGELVDLQAARRLSRAAGASTIVPGAGCASRICSAHHAPGRFAFMRWKKARAVLAGKRTLVLTPATVAARVLLRAVPPSIAEAIARSVLTPTDDAPPRVVLRSGLTPEEIQEQQPQTNPTHRAGTWKCLFAHRAGTSKWTKIEGEDPA
jgi:hypothetical protein